MNYLLSLLLPVVIWQTGCRLSRRMGSIMKPINLSPFNEHQPNHSLKGQNREKYPRARIRRKSPKCQMPEQTHLMAAHELLTRFDYKLIMIASCINR